MLKFPSVMDWLYNPLPQNEYIFVLIYSIWEHDLILKYDLYRSNQVKTRSSGWPCSNRTGTLEKGENWTQRQACPKGQNSCVKTGRMLPQPGNYLRRRVGEAWKRPLLVPSQGAEPCQHLHLRLLASRTLRLHTSEVLRYPVSGTLL